MRAWTAAAAAALGGALYHGLLRERLLNWGAQEAEAGARLPGDELLEDADVVATRAVTVDALPSAVWPWIARLRPDKTAPPCRPGGSKNAQGVSMISCSASRITWSQAGRWAPQGLLVLAR